ncbi:hypothetical protein DH2020_021191 [Rehmannia glutinosa]|uniref:Chromodomain-helicase-DNA-binding protein n=1 Tax=Rehmannia glutinosa TaxID=99300 RepID=A0ABR0WC70_REHGL
MVNDTRSARKSKDEGKDQASGVRKSARETSLSRQMTPSPQSMRKSKRLEKGTPPLTPTLKRKSERLGKYNTPSPLRRSDRGKKFFSSTSSASKRSGKELTLSELKRKKKNLIQVTMESEKAELDLEAVGMKRKKLNSRSFKALFKRQRIKEIVPDGDGELEGRDKLLDVCSDNSRGIGSETMGNGAGISDECSRRMVGKLRDESIDNASDGAPQKSICSLNQCHVDTENDVNMDSSHRDNVLDEPCSKYSHPRSSVRGKLDYPEGLPTNCSSTENMDASVSESSTCLAKAHDGSVCSDISEKCMRSRGMFYIIHRNLDLTIISVGKDVILSVAGATHSPSPSAQVFVGPLLKSLLMAPYLMGLRHHQCYREIWLYTWNCDSVKHAAQELFADEGCFPLCKWVAYNSPEQELCSCNPSVNEDRGSFSTRKDRSDHKAAVTSETAEKCDCRHLSTETQADFEMDGHGSVCALCKKDGELLCCVGKGCKRCYHLCCLDPPLTDALPGVWHCPVCVKKKLLFGVHSVSKGVESVWDVREVEVSNAKGVRQRQYLVKYHGLAHVHNHWVPEKQLLLENPCLASEFIEKDQAVRWSTEWTVPHRLLRKRSIQDNIYIASSSVISVCNYECLVKWHGLSYDHATWELDNADFLSSSLGQNLMKDYEIRCQKAKHEVNQRPASLAAESMVRTSAALFSFFAFFFWKHRKGSTVKLSELPASQSLVNDNYVLKNVNKLRECLFKCQNAVVFDDQERAMTIIFFLRSMSEIRRPFLIVTASSSLSQWEAEFARLVPSVDVVVYSGNSDTRKGIRASEFYDEAGRLMLQDRDRLRSIKWEAIVIDEYQHFGISNDLEQIKMFTTDCRILLVSGQITDTTAEYLKMLSLLESHGDLDKLGGLKSQTNDNLCRLKDRLSHFIAYGSNSQVSKFLEYWVPVQISNYQLEQYCATLLSNSVTLCSCSRNDRCCDHPYLLDSSVQERLIAEQRAAELLDVGIKASGKLELLDMMLTEIHTQGLQVLVLFQLISGSGGVTSTGDILDDFLRQRFGKDSYERSVDGGVSIPSKKQAVVNRFNKKETGHDWNPANDLRALQKISFGSKVEQIKVFSRATTDTLLSWGAVYLFSKLDEYHADGNSTLDSLNFSPGQLLLSEVTKEFQAILSENCENTDSNSVIAKVKLGVRSYSTNIPTLGEAKVQLKDGEVPNIFLEKLVGWEKLYLETFKGAKSTESEEN